MKLERLMELAGVKAKAPQLNELNDIEVTHNTDTISSLRAKLKAANVNTNGLSDELVLKFANAMKEITIENMKLNGDLIK